MKENYSRHWTAFRLWMSYEVSVEGNFITSFDEYRFKWKLIDEGRLNTSSMDSNVGEEQEIILNSIEQR